MAFNPDDNVSSARPRSESLDGYPHAYTDFWRGVHTKKCIYKSGPEWPVLVGPSGWKPVRVPRPVGRHPIAETWRDIKDSIETCLDSLHVQWTGIDPLAFANKGDQRPFCELLVYISVSPHSLAYDDAVVGSAAVKEILVRAGFPSIDSAFVEALVLPHTSRKLLAGVLNFDRDQAVLKLEKPFSTVLGAPIAAFSQPCIRGSVGLVLRLGGARTVLLTCSHVARPPVSEEGMSDDSQEPIEFVVLDNESYDASIAAMRKFVDIATLSIDAWKKLRERTTDPADKADYSQLVGRAERNIQQVQALQGEVTESFSSVERRIVGALFHAEPVTSFMNDWALVDLYPDQVGPDFIGNKLFLGHRTECQNWHELMFPGGVYGTETRQTPEDGYLKVCGVVSREQMMDPPHVDNNGDRCLIVVKNGATSNITIGRTNTLESSSRIYGKTHDDTHTSGEIAVIGYNNLAFSEPGDSGSIVLDRDGRVVGLLTSGNGLTESTDWSYITPFWSIQSQIEAKFGNFTLYDSE